MQLSGYTIHQTVYHSDSTRVYRGVAKNSGRPVIIKQIQANRTSLKSRLRREFELVSAIQDSAVVEPVAYEADLELPAVIYADFGGAALSEAFAEKRSGWPCLDFLDVAIRMAEILQVIHNHGVIHQDVKPANIIYNSQTGEVRFTDFGIAVRRDGAFGTMPSLRMRGTLAYMAPEQSGRMNRAIDHRADLYSLGVTFYEGLTGRLPFEISDDALEMIHRHIAVRPADPHSLNSAVPETVSAVVMKLLAKDAEDRYQSAHGLVQDLRECRQRLQSGEVSTKFVPGKNDVSDVFVVSRKLYGRDSERAVLIEAIRRVVSGAREFCLVRGFAGIGKSSVVFDLQDAVLESRGFFVSGKFDQFQLGIPYSGILRAFRQLVNEILKGEADEVESCRRRLLEALGVNGQIIAEVIPEIERIIGPQPEPISVGPEESENRFINVFQDFVRTLASVEHPLVLFVDDLHWADPASLRLLRLLMLAPDMSCLMILGAYRDNEVDADHPLERTIASLQMQDIEVRFVEIRPLDAEEVNRMVSATLQAPADETRILAEFVHQKGGGNPFFVRELLQILHRDGHIRFDSEQGRWSWDAAHISSLPAPDRIGELMVHKLHYMSGETRVALQFAACMGSRFDRAALVTVLQCSDVELEERLRPALREGLLSPLLPGSDDRVANMESTLEFAGADGHYQFQHDRIQQAAYDSIETAERESAHLQIAGQLIRKVGDAADALDESIFSIVHHLDAAGDAIEAQHERRTEYAKLYLRAGQRALGSAAYQAAADAAGKGVALLPPDAWEAEYELARKLYEVHAEAEHLSSRNARCIEIIEEILRYVDDPLDRVVAYETHLRALTALGEIEKVITVGLEALGSLGFVLPPNPGRPRVLIQTLWTQWQIFRRGIDSVVSAPETRDPYARAALGILPLIGAPMYKLRQNLWAIWACAYVELSYRAGWATASPYGLTSMAGMLLGMGRHRFARALSIVSLKLQDRIGSSNHAAKTLFAHGAIVEHWFESLEKGFENLLRGSRTGIEAGDIEYGGYCHHYYCVHSFYSVGDLADLEAEFAVQYRLINNYGNENVQGLNRIYYQLIMNLRHGEGDVHLLNGEVYDEEHGLQQLYDRKYISAVVIHQSVRALLRYLFDRPEEALASVQEADRLLHYVPAMYFYTLNLYLEALILCALGPESELVRRRYFKKRMKQLFRKFETWAGLNPAVYEHKLSLLRAEYFRIRGDFSRAVNSYTAAIKGAHARGYLLDEALACELAGEHYRKQGNDRIARTYIEEARAVFRRWGADARVRHLESKYPDWFSEAGAADEASASNRATLESTIAFATRSAGGDLDTETVTKAVQMLFAGQSAAAVMQEFLRLSVENAGAQRGALILRRGEELWLEAVRELEPQLAAEFRAQRFESYTALPREIINYVLHSGESIVLANAREGGEFTADPYVRRSGARSILVAPVVYQSDVRGVLYLENRLAANVFTRPRLQILSVLSHQAAVSLENARLYEHMQSEIGEKTRQLLNLKLARDRMDPHFLFNSLNMVHALMSQDPARANEALMAVADLYRTLTDISEAELVDFELEWRFLEDYLKLMRLRFNQSLTVEIERPETLPTIRIPPLCLQPIAENSFKHGFRMSTDRMELRIRLSTVGDEVRVEFQDNGGGFEDDVQPGDTLHSIRERLAHYFGRAELSTENLERGSRTIVRLAPRSGEGSGQAR